MVVCFGHNRVWRRDYVVHVWPCFARVPKGKFLVNSKLVQVLIRVAFEYVRLGHDVPYDLESRPRLPFLLSHWRHLSCL